MKDGDYLAARDLGPYLGRVQVDYVVCVAAVVRCLTVRRAAALTGGEPTNRSCQEPEVPIWDVVQFPLSPPRGFRGETQSAVLGERWDLVAWCKNCGGHGTVSQSYSDTEYKASQTHEGLQWGYVTVTKWRQVTCPICGDAKRLRYPQVLHTEWRPLFPVAAFPDVPQPERTHEAAEVLLAQARLVEDFEAVPHVQVEGSAAGTTLERDLRQSLSALLGWHEKKTEAVERTQGGKLYRADFRLVAFRVVRVRACQARGLTGWFFGQLPELHLPRVPLSYGALATMVFLPPLVLAAGIAILAGLWALLGAFLVLP